MTPAEAIDRLAGGLNDVRRREVGNTVEYDRAGAVFAIWETGRLSFRLRADIVAAALRTPDSAPSVRGGDWIELAPSATDSFTLDRAVAWFESAWRLAGESTAHGAAPN